MYIYALLPYNKKKIIIKNLVSLSYIWTFVIFVKIHFPLSSFEKTTNYYTITPGLIKLLRIFFFLRYINFVK